MYCKKCGKERNGQAEFCGYCGNSFIGVNGTSLPDSAKDARSKKRKLILTGVIILAGIVFLLASGTTVYYTLVKTDSTTKAAETVQKTTHKSTEETDEDTTVSSATAAAAARTTQGTTRPVYAEIDRRLLTVTGTSYLDSINDGVTTYDYYPTNVVDGDKTTCWCEGAEGDGLGQSITLALNAPRELHGLIIYGGLYKSEALFNKNNRPKKVELTFSDGTVLSYTLKDGYKNQPSKINFESGITVDFVKIKIISVYAGTKYEDTCISEIKLIGD